ncbi:distal tail protein Dit [Priestia megaterium]|uniref:distal tail protein Dit n=1 Tax=Priestia megaterium TaxID=1404 RepID=UPI0023D9B48B|nr:distal tail protein Dit [Priestia megaterium]MDF2010190.1 phage tail family protein [Priestia megaterium]
MITLNDVRIPEFIKVNNVGFSVLPPIENNLLAVRGKAGLYNFGQQVGQREFTVTYTLVAEKINGVMSASRELAEWLHHEEAVKLVFDDEPDKYYLVLPDGETNINEILNIGQGEIKFVCTEPYAYGKEHEFEHSPTDSEPFYLQSKGSAEAHPQIELTMKKDVNAISVISDDGFVMIGEPAGVEDAVKDANPVVLFDDMSTTNLWTTATSVEGGIITGELESNGYSFHVKNQDYGEGSAWHGASAIRSLPKQITDFHVQAKLGMTGDELKQVTRIDIMLLDANNECFGKLEFADKWNNQARQVFEARAGKLTGGHYFINEFSETAWHDFKGIVHITRTGQKWTASIGKYEPSLKDYRSRTYAEWIDTKGIAKNKLAKIQINIATYGTNTPYKDAYVDDITVFERLTLKPNEVPIIARKGDVLTIDNEKAIVLKNGEPFYEGLNPASDFFTFKQGMNGLSLSPPVADISIKYKERWL